VSTRIILCVFVSTLLTALIVSWLSVGAIHSDVRSRVSRRTLALIDDRAAELDAWHARASTQLASSAAIGSPWHTALVAALDAQPPGGRENLNWVDGAVAGGGFEASSRPSLTLPPPPAELARYLDRLTLTPPSSLAGPAARSMGCLSVRVELIRASSDLAGTLEGCLDNETILDFLQPPVGDLRGLRLLLTDKSGRVTAAEGVRADGRVDAELPMASLLYPDAGQLADYADPDGTRLVASIAPLKRTGWYLVAEAEHAEAFAPAIAITRQIFIVDVCIILLFSVLAYKITLAIMQPIEALSQGAKRIASGHVDHQIPLPANNDDELGLLTRTFNDMMRKLRSNQLEIEEDRIRLAEKNEELQRANEILAQLSITDGLTKLHNHRYFQDHLTREIKRVSRTDAPLSMILIDIDDFKQLNDVHGHAAGDEVLVALAAIMNDSARESDLIARYGGEEFVILMPNTDLAGAVHLAEKVRMAVESTRLIIGDSMKPIDVTISLGVAVYDGNRREFFAEADRALYQAKAHGKNCVIIAGSEHRDPSVPPAAPG
jgi:diguanylate cyclase (GGDEF)-like protein